jgi:hypothetical protein
MFFFFHFLLKKRKYSTQHLFAIFLFSKAFSLLSSILLYQFFIVNRKEELLRLPFGLLDNFSSIQYETICGNPLAPLAQRPAAQHIRTADQNI